MKRLRKFNDLAHVAGWVSEQTGETWDAVDVVDSCIRHGVIPHIQALAPAFADNVLPDWARDGSPVEVVFNLDLPRFLAGEGVVHMVRHNGVIFTMTPGMPASIDALRLTDHAALQLLERMTERKQRNANQESAPAMQSGDAQSSSEAAPAADADEQLAELFDPVKPATLEAMFPDGGRWKTHAERAKRNGLKESAWTEGGSFNPYSAARWWLERQAPAGWTWDRCARKLAGNLPARSRDSKHLLIGDYD